MKITSLLLLLFLFLGSYYSLGNNELECIPEKPNPPVLVNDFANILTENQVKILENDLALFAQETTNQICIVTVNELCGDKALFAYEIGEKWGVGDARFNNGIVILIKPKLEREKGEAFIAVGYGLEGKIPDALAKKIVENEMIPNFKEGNYYEGIYNAILVIEKLAREEFPPDQYGKQYDGSFGFVLFIFLSLFGLFFFYAIRRAKKYAKEHGVSIGEAFRDLEKKDRKSSSNHFGGSSWGSSGGRSSGSGGFGGFGGGHFGGGGAGGSW
ncbi:MAG: TPM domain-containing protein [Brumimicrobium sp.]|nr:TPM domain-containing protein [Brumimicrobium sp.]